MFDRPALRCGQLAEREQPPRHWRAKSIGLDEARVGCRNPMAGGCVMEPETEGVSVASSLRRFHEASDIVEDPRLGSRSLVGCSEDRFTDEHSAVSAWRPVHFDGRRTV